MSLYNTTNIVLHCILIIYNI